MRNCVVVNYHANNTSNPDLEGQIEFNVWLVPQKVKNIIYVPKCANIRNIFFQEISKIDMNTL